MSMTCAHPTQEAGENPDCRGCKGVLRWLAAGTEPRPIQARGSVSPVAVAREWLSFVGRKMECPLTDGDPVLVADFLAMSVMDLTREVASLRAQIVELSVK